MHAPHLTATQRRRCPRRLPPPAARVLGRHRRRWRGVLRQLPEVLRARAHRMAAQRWASRSSSMLQHDGVMFVVTDTALRYRRAARLDDLLERHRAAAAGRPGVAAASRSRPGATTTLLAEGEIRIGCVAAAPRRDLPALPHPRGDTPQDRMNQDLSIFTPGAACQLRGAARHGRADDRVAGQLDGDLRQVLRPEARAPGQRRVRARFLVRAAA